MAEGDGQILVGRLAQGGHIALHAEQREGLSKGGCRDSWRCDEVVHECCSNGSIAWCPGILGIDTCAPTMLLLMLDSYTAVLNMSSNPRVRANLNGTLSAPRHTSRMPIIVSRDCCV